MNIGEGIGKIARKIDRRLNVPESVDASLYHDVQKIAGNKYEPRLTGKGGEHLVFTFEDPKHPDTVYKVNHITTAALLRARQLGPKSEAETRADIDRQIQRRNHRTRELRDYFGFQAVPVQKYMIRDVPVNLGSIARLAPTIPIDPKYIPESIPAWVTVQRKINLPKESTVSLNGYYPEQRIDPENIRQRKLLIQAGELLLNGDTGGEDLDRQKEIVCMLYDNLRQVQVRAELDPNFKAQLQEAVRKIIHYTSETENTLDMAGKNNLVLTKSTENWNLKLLDPLPNTDFTFTDLREAIAKLDNDKPLSPHQWIKSLNILNTIRVINSLAILADIPERLRVIADPDEITVDIDDEFDIDVSFDDSEPNSLTPIDNPTQTPTSSRYLKIPVIPFLNVLCKKR